MSRLNKAAENLTCAIRRHSLGSRSGPRSAVVRSSRLCNAAPSSLKEPPRSRLQNVLHHFKMHAGLSSRMVLEPSRCPLWIISGHCSSLHDLCFTTESRYQLSAFGCPLSANKSWMTKSAWPLMCRWNKHVADTAYGANGIGVSRIKFYLSAQACNP